MKSRTALSIKNSQTLLFWIVLALVLQLSCCKEPDKFPTENHLGNVLFIKPVGTDKNKWKNRSVYMNVQFDDTFGFEGYWRIENDSIFCYSDVDSSSSMLFNLKAKKGVKYPVTLISNWFDFADGSKSPQIQHLKCEMLDKYWSTTFTDSLYTFRFDSIDVQHESRDLFFVLSKKHGFLSVYGTRNFEHCSIKFHKTCLFAGDYIFYKDYFTEDFSVWFD